MLAFSPNTPYPPIAGDFSEWQRVTEDDMIDMGRLHLSARTGRGRTLPELVRANDGLALGALLATSPHRIDERDTEGWTALHVAVLAQNLDLVQVLLALHANPHLDGPERAMPLHLAAMLGNVAIAKALIASGAFIDAENDTGMTPLMLAAAGGHAQVLPLLLGGRTNVRKQAACGSTALAFAARAGHTFIVGTLLDAKADPNTADETGRAPLSYAAAAGHDGAVARLLEARANFKAVDHRKMTALAYAAAGGHSLVVKALLRAGAYVHAADADGRTALTHAAAGGHHACVALLLKAHADPNPGPTDATSPLYLALRAGNIRSIKLLEKAGTRAPDSEDEMAEWFDGLGYDAARFLMTICASKEISMAARVFQLGEQQGQAALMAAAGKMGHHQLKIMADGEESRIGRARGYDCGRLFKVTKPYMEKATLLVDFAGLLGQVITLKPRSDSTVVTHKQLVEAIRATGAFFTINYALADALFALNDAWQVLADARGRPARRRVESALAWVITTAAGMHDVVERPVEAYAGRDDEHPSLRLRESHAKRLAPLVANQAAGLMKQAAESQKQLDLPAICAEVERHDISPSDQETAVPLLMNRFGLHALVARAIARALTTSDGANDKPALRQALLDTVNAPRFLKHLESDELGGTLRPLAGTSPRHPTSIDMTRGLIVWQIDTLLASVA